jgi:hypothetical protein
MAVKEKKSIKEISQNIEWGLRGQFTRISGFGIIVVGLVIGAYRYFLLNSTFMEFFVIIFLSFFIGGLFLLISWFYLSDAMEKTKVR